MLIVPDSLKGVFGSPAELAEELDPLNMLICLECYCFVPNKFSLLLSHQEYHHRMENSNG